MSNYPPYALLRPESYQTLLLGYSLGISFIFSASDDIHHADEVQTLIKDIWDLRIAKLRKSIDLMVAQHEIQARVCEMFL